jgi:hypothetical protein
MWKAVVVLVLLVAGCASDPFELAKQQQAAGQAVCQQRREAGEFKTHVADMQCRMAAQAPVVAELDRWGQGDIARQAQAEKLLAAEQWDQGKITEGEFSVAVARINANASSAQQARVAHAIRAAYANYTPAPIVVQSQAPAAPSRMHCTNEAYLGTNCTLY